MPAEAEFLCSPWTSKTTFSPYHLDARHSFLVFQGCSSFPDLSGLGPLDFFPKTYPICVPWPICLWHAWDENCQIRCMSPRCVWTQQGSQADPSKPMPHSFPGGLAYSPGFLQLVLAKIHVSFSLIVSRVTIIHQTLILYVKVKFLPAWQHEKNYS